MLGAWLNIVTGSGPGAQEDQGPAPLSGAWLTCAGAQHRCTALMRCRVGLWFILLLTLSLCEWPCVQSHVRPWVRLSQSMKEIRRAQLSLERKGPQGFLLSTSKRGNEVLDINTCAWPSRGKKEWSWEGWPRARLWLRHLLFSACLVSWEVLPSPGCAHLNGVCVERSWKVCVTVDAWLDFKACWLHLGAHVIGGRVLLNGRLLCLEIVSWHLADGLAIVEWCFNWKFLNDLWVYFPL